jgi:cytidyltransferase-like protein
LLLESNYKMAEKVRGLGAYEFGNLRHEYSKALMNGDIYKTDGFLTTGERKLCKEKGMILPRPIKPSEVDKKRLERIYDMDWWMCRIGATVDGDPAFGVWQREGTWDVSQRPAYIVDGTFDIVHGGHWSLVKAASELALKNGGYLYFLIQSNRNVEQYKNRPPIFDEITRASWFSEPDERIDGTVVWEFGKSWETGYEILGSLMRPNSIKNVFFFLPDAESHLPHKEGYDLWRRELQVERAGFSVINAEDTYLGDVSSSKLRNKFNLAPTNEVLEKHGK